VVFPALLGFTPQSGADLGRVYGLTAIQGSETAPEFLDRLNVPLQKSFHPKLKEMNMSNVHFSIRPVFFLLLAGVFRAPAQDIPAASPYAAMLRNALQTDAVKASNGESALFQVSTLDALLQGIYSGSYTVGQLKQHGDFGLGTYEGIDGEMIVVNGHYYHMRSNGVLSEAADTEIVPFAAVTQFKGGVSFTVSNISMADLSTLLDTLLPSKNYFYAIRIHGTFSAMSTRAIPLQNYPYPVLATLTPTQIVFNYSNVLGTAVDIRSPAYVSGINQVAHHYHFVSDDLTGGGHSLSFTTGPVTVEIQTLRRFSLVMPADVPFANASLPYTP
jgi:acetolactate decarboxylase